MKQLFASFLLLFFCKANAQEYNPVANEKATVTNGKARFTVLTDGLLRMEYSNDSGFCNQASLTFVNRNLPVPQFQVQHENGWLVITTSQLTLHYQEGTGAFTAKNLRIDYKDASRNFSWKPGTKDKQNLKGTTRTLDGVIGKFSLYGMKKIKLEDGIISRSGWALIDDSEKPLFDNSEWPWVEARKTAEQDLYFFGYGNNYKKAMFDFISVAGKISLPPKFAFGIWYSRYWNYTEQEMKDIVNDYEKNDIPLDVLVVDMDWHETEKSSPEIFKNASPKLNGWTGFTWEKKYFPDYKEFLQWTNNKRIQTCMNLHPAAGVQWHEDAYSAFAKAMNFDTSKRAAIPFDITNKNFAKNYFDVLLHPYEKAGVDFWWLDWQQWGSTNIKGVNPTFYLNYVHYSDMQRQGKRPLIFHRWGGLGNHRYQIGFSGDYIIDWKGLAYQPEFTSTAANVGFGFWSHDIGAHMGFSKTKKQDAELFTRWVQWGAFSPIFRTHATADGEIERRIWKYPETNFIAMRSALQQRYALIPYIYTYSRMAYDSGVSLIRPMYYEHPTEEKAYNVPHQYYFGNNMIVAPVYESMKRSQAATQTVWLPEGNWYDYTTHELIKGGKNYTSTYSLNQIPVFVKDGSIIPTQTAKLRVAGSVLDTLILTVYAQQTATFNLYEDEGTTEGYKRSEFSFTHFSYTKNSVGATFTIQPDGKQFAGMVTERCYKIKMPCSTKPSSVTSNGANTIWSYDGEAKQLLIYLPKQKLTQITVSIN